jgi:hypothetical protein
LIPFLLPSKKNKNSQPQDKKMNSSLIKATEKLQLFNTLEITEKAIKNIGDTSIEFDNLEIVSNDSNKSNGEHFSEEPSMAVGCDQDDGNAQDGTNEDDQDGDGKKNDDEDSLSRSSSSSSSSSSGDSDTICTALQHSFNKYDGEMGGGYLSPRTVSPRRKPVSRMIPPTLEL